MAKPYYYSESLTLYLVHNFKLIVNNKKKKTKSKRQIKQTLLKVNPIFILKSL